MACSFDLVEPFETDNGELDGCAPDLAFCLGVEWQLFRDREAATRSAFTAQVNVHNVVRLLRLLDRRGRRAKVVSQSGSWSQIEVSAAEVVALPS